MSHRPYFLLCSFTACVFAFGFGFGCGTKDKPPDPNEPPIKISADDLYAAYTKDSQKANDRYRGKTVQVTGIIQGLDQAVILGEKAGVACYIKPEGADKLGLIWLNDIVTVKGVCKGPKNAKAKELFVDVTDAEIIDIKKKDTK